MRARIERLQGTYPGVGCETAGDEVHITIPDRYRVGHEAHFAQVVEEFLKYLKSPKSMPAWERPNMLAKYFVTTTGVQMASPETRKEKSGVRHQGLEVRYRNSCGRMSCARPEAFIFDGAARQMRWMWTGLQWYPTPDPITRFLTSCNIPKNDKHHLVCLQTRTGV